jgi:hypothetical protein
MHPALLKLTWMLLKGWVRRQFSGAGKGGSIQKTILSTVGAFLFLIWFGSFAIRMAFQNPVQPENALLILPLILTVMGLFPILLGNEDRGLVFSPAEIDFLFPGPFSRRDLVLMKVFRMVLGSVFGAVFFGCSLRWCAAGVLQSILGAGLALVFVNLLSTMVALARNTVRERWYLLARYGALGVLVLAAAGAGLYLKTVEVPTFEQLKQLGQSAPVQTILAPAKVFAHVFVASSLVEVMAWTLACLGMIGAALLAVLSLDKGYMTVALAASERRQARLARMGKGIKTGKPARAVAIPSLHGLGAVGAIIKRQCITAVRTSRAWMIAFLIGIGYGYLMSRLSGHVHNESGQKDLEGTLAVVRLVPGMLMLGMVLPQVLRFDFRGDLDHLENLKSLPISPMGAAIAELAVPTLILSAQAWMVVAGVAMFGGTPTSVIVMGCLAVVPLSAMLFALENFVFLIVPTRMYAPGQAATMFSGRRLLYVVARLMLLGTGGGLVAVVGLAAWFISYSVWGTFIACWIALVAIAAGLLPAVAWAFKRFDVSADMPA